MQEAPDPDTPTLPWNITTSSESVAEKANAVPLADAVIGVIALAVACPDEAAPKAGSASVKVASKVVNPVSE
jgi:hypothetical protein